MCEDEKTLQKHLNESKETQYGFKLFWHFNDNNFEQDNQFFKQI